MEFLRHAIYASIRTAPRTIGKLFKSRLPHEGDAAAHKLTDRVMQALESYEVKEKKVAQGWQPGPDDEEEKP